MNLKVSSKLPEVQARFLNLVQSFTSHHKIGFDGDEIAVRFEQFSDDTQAQVTPYLKDKRYVIQLHSKLRGRQRDFSFLHELTHGAQYKTGELCLVPEYLGAWDYRFIWQGKRMCTVKESWEMPVQTYMNLPWEREADEVAKKCLKGLTHRCSVYDIKI